MLGSVERMVQKSGAVPKDIVERAIETREKFSRRSRRTPFATSPQGEGNIACMTGKAGTGKSTTLDACRLAWELSGKTVLGCALAGNAAEELRSASGIESRTLHSTLYQIEKGWLKMTPRHVMVLDEAGMVPTRLMAKLIEEVEKAGAKLVLVGDADQLQAIGAGGPFKSIAERIGQCELAQIRRQREQWRRDTVDQFSRGQAKEALTTYAAKGQLHVTKTREEALAALVERWKADKGIEQAAGRAFTRLAQCGGKGDEPDVPGGTKAGRKAR